MDQFTRSQKRNKWKKRILIALATLVLIAAATVGGLYLNKRNQENAAKAREASILKKKADKKKAEEAAKALEEKHLKEEPLYAEYKDNGLTYEMIVKGKTLKATFIGDSVMLGSEYGIKELFPQATLDNSVSRQAYEAPALVEKHAKAGNLGDAVVLNLGTNGSITEEDIKSTIKNADGRPVYWVVENIDRDWSEPNKQILLKADKSEKKLHLIRWDEEVAKGDTNHSWFTPDGIHPSVEGQQHYYTFIAKNVLGDFAKK